MTADIKFTVPNAAPDLLAPLRRNCAALNGSLLTRDNGDGTSMAVCLVTTAETDPAADATHMAAFAAPLQSPAADWAASTAADKRLDDLTQLHPVVRDRVRAVQDQLEAENIPMKLFEAFRSPQRQAKLYAQGRTAPGPKVTNAKAWESYHQYGLAADFVRFENNSWNWKTDTPRQRADWDRFHEIAGENGLEPLSWERPHVQIVGVSLTDLRNGAYPAGGDESWSDTLARYIAGWPGSDKPPLPQGGLRPAMPTPPVQKRSKAATGPLTWQSRFGGDAWAYDQNGLYTRDHDGGLKTWRSVGAPITVQEVLAKLGTPIFSAAQKYDVPPELIVMTIATEAGAYRKSGFTGASTFRWEQGYVVGATGDPDLDGRETGDYSAGPMQVMADTARWMNSTKGLGYDAATMFAFFRNKPTQAPADLGLYDVDVCIDVGTAYIRHHYAETGGNPLLVAAAYNAGGLRASNQNHWRLKSHGTHLDRAAEWYGDACFVLYS